ncbi:hypothetical protein [Nocardioides sp. 1609]|uniref:hypothetical protein n=1 Tax=Nocardioides sp. 1609 TaxID=2508327 RepID=UPI001ADC8485|nr:hypothetical protein [Nocardioides sp. 1609]
MPIGTHRRVAAGAAALALVATTLALVAGVVAAAAASPSYAGACTGDDARSGVTVVVDFQQLDGNGGTAAPTIVRCSPGTVAADGTVTPRTGHQALVDAGLTPTGVDRWGDAFVCRINGRPALSETLPVRSNPRYRERCTETPPAAAYWSYWYADGGGQDWRYSEHGVLNRDVVPGGFEGWSFALDATAESNPPPRHLPVNPAVDPDAPQVALTSDRLDATLVLGGSTTLRWTSRNADRLTASGAWTGDLARPGGARTVRPTTAGTHRYEVTARSADGTEVRDVLTLEVVGAGPDPGPDPAPDPAPGGQQDLPVDPAARQVSGWLVGELVDGTMPAPIPTSAESTDWGLTVDTLWALYAAGTGREATRTILDALDRDAGDYLGVRLFGDADVRRAGPTAKVLLAAVVAGRDPRSFGRVMRADGSLTAGRYDLRRETLSLVARRGPQVGRVRDSGVGIDNTNTFSQALAVIALARSGGVPTVAVDYLVRQQCAAGYFRMFDRSDRTCDQDADAADGDGTAMGLQALMTARANGVAGLDDEIDRGVAWLVRVQRRDGSFGGGTSTEGSNTNSTGLVAQTLAAAGRRPAFRRAQAFVRSLSVVPAPRTGPLATERGAIAYDAGSLAAARATGITGRDQWRRATTQAIFALAPVSFVTLGERAPRGEPEAPDRGDEPTPATPPATGTTAPGSPAPPSSTGSATGSGTGGEPALTVPGSPPVAPAAATPSGRLGAHLAASLVDGDHVEVTVDATAYVDYDLTAEVVLALRQSGEQPGAARRATRFLLDRRSVAAYVGAAPYERAATYVEPLARLVLVALASDRPADAARASALADRLAGRADPTGFAAGGADDDVASTTRSAWAVLALTAAGRPEAAAGAVATLVGAPCDDGLFPTTVAGGAGCATGDPVATALVVQALDATVRPPDSGPADAPADRAPAAWPGERTAALAGAGAALRSAVTVDGGLTLDDDRVSALAAVAIARQAVGLDSTRTRDVLVGTQRTDGGLPATLGATPVTVSDLSTSAAAAPAVAGTSWLTSSASPLEAQVLLPLAAEPDADTSDPVRSDAAAGPVEPGLDWPAWAALALAAVVLLLSLPRLLAPEERSTP